MVFDLSYVMQKVGKAVDEVRPESIKACPARATNRSKKHASVPQ